MNCRRRILVGVLLVAVVALFLGSMSVYTAEKKVVSITYGEAWKALFEPAIEEFEAATGVKVEKLTIPPGVDWTEKVALDFAAGVAADVVQVDSFMIPAWAGADYLYPLDDYLAEWPAWDLYYPGMQEIVSYEGLHLGVMFTTDVRMLWYWKPIFEKAGIPIPWKPKNWIDVLSAALTIKEKVPEVTAPFFIPMGTKWGEGATMQGFYMALLGADTPEGDRNRLRDWEAEKWIGSSPAIEKALGFYRDVFITYELCPTEPHYVPAVWDEWRRMMREGEIGIGLGGSWEWGSIWPADIRPPVEERKELLGWAPMPGCGKPDAPETATVSGGWALAINAETNVPDLAWELMTYVNDKVRTATWLAKGGRIVVRKDAVEVPVYKDDEYLIEAIKLMEYSTYRDTYPGYTKVSFFIQEATADVAVEGLSLTTVMERYKEKLIEEFGADMVKTIP